MIFEVHLCNMKICSFYPHPHGDWRTGCFPITKYSFRERRIKHRRLGIEPTGQSVFDY